VGISEPVQGMLRVYTQRGTTIERKNIISDREKDIENEIATIIAL
jgi:hypothetical protein